MLLAKYSVMTDCAQNIPVSIVRFPTGEVTVKLEVAPGQRVRLKNCLGIWVQGYDANTLFILACIKNAVEDLFLRSRITADINLYMPYLPNARYDRHMVDGDGFALQVFCSMLNLLSFNRVVVSDPHSDVAGALIKNFVQIPQHALVMDTIRLFKKDFDVLVAPDAGAAKKIYKTAQALALPVVTMSKSRDVSTGEINGVVLMDALPDNAKCLIIDDICDGGRTFTEAAKVLRGAGAEAVSLYVTHGIFSKGVQVLLDNGIEHIYTTNSYSDWESNSQLTVNNLFS